MALIHSTKVPLLKLTAALAKAAGLSFSVSAGIIGVLAVTGKRSHKRSKVICALIWHARSFWACQRRKVMLFVRCPSEVKCHTAVALQMPFDIDCRADVRETL